MSGIEEQDVNQLIDTLNELDLPEPQRKLMDAIVKVAGDIKDADERAFSSEFSDAFTKEKADLVLEYVADPRQSTAYPGSIIRNPNAVGPGIIRVPPHPEPTPDPHDEH